VHLGGEYTVFVGLEEHIRLVAIFKFKEEEIDLLRTFFPTCEDKFFSYPRELNCLDIEIYAIL